SRAASPPAAEDKEIRERAKELASQVLQRGRVDPDAVREIVRAVIGGPPGTTAASGADAREIFADAVGRLARRWWSRQARHTPLCNSSRHVGRTSATTT